MYIPKEGDITIYRIRNAHRIPVITVAYTFKYTNVRFGISICSPKDKPVKSKGDLIAISRLKSGKSDTKQLYKLGCELTVCDNTSYEKLENEIGRLSRAIKRSSYYNG